MKYLLPLLFLALAACAAPDQPAPPPATDLPEADCDKPGRVGPDGQPLPPC